MDGADDVSTAIRCEIGHAQQVLPLRWTWLTIICPCKEQKDGDETMDPLILTLLAVSATFLGAIFYKRECPNDDGADNRTKTIKNHHDHHHK